MFENWGIRDLLKFQPALRLLPAGNGPIQIAGALEFVVEPPGKDRIEDAYEIRMETPRAFPKDLPSVWETGGRVPKDFHKMYDGSLCLGSPTRQMLLLQREPTLTGFINSCVVPYLYGYSYFEKHEKLPFDELNHGPLGLIEDYCSIFDVGELEAGIQMVKLASIRKRFANKYQCPCGSGRRLGKCHNLKVNAIRKQLGRKWFEKELNLVLALIERAKQAASKGTNNA
ncbi:MAG: hypothetical protein M5U26_10315 [Planctomycetota bacterium]|nr:hypothetical protein [Planctomycetota bacterium]